MTTVEKRLDAVAHARGLLADALFVLERGGIANERLVGLVRQARHEAAQHERELMHVQTRTEERERQCRRSTNS